MNLTSLQSIVDQVAASETFKDTNMVTEVNESQGQERFLISNEDPPNYYDPDIIINATDAELVIKDGIEL